jgi:hypothetical protein
VTDVADDSEDLIEGTDNLARVIQTAVDIIEHELRLPSGFFAGLASEDDWSFVIKIHALIEATVTHLLSNAVDPKLRPVFERLPLSGGPFGKTTFAEAVGAMSRPERRFVQQLSELRNKLVHDVLRVSFRFDEYLGTLDKNQRKAFGQSDWRGRRIGRWKVGTGKAEGVYLECDDAACHEGAESSQGGSGVVETSATETR